MNVYIVMREITYEKRLIHALFSTEESADAYAERMKANPLAKAAGLDYIVEEYEIDREEHAQ